MCIKKVYNYNGSGKRKKKVHVITVATHKERYFDVLVQSAKKMNVDMVVLGMNQKWEGFHMKYTLVDEYIKDLPPDDIIVFLDAFDSLILKKFDNFADEFNKTNSRWVVPAYRPTNYIESYIGHRIYGPGDILVTCLWAAKVETLKQDIPKLLHIMKENDFYEDQFAMNKLHKENSDTKIYSDFDGRFFTLDTDVAMNGTSYFISAPMNKDLDDICHKLLLVPPERMDQSSYWLHPKNIEYLKRLKFEVTVFLILLFSVLWFTFSSASRK